MRLRTAIKVLRNILGFREYGGKQPGYRCSTAAKAQDVLTRRGLLLCDRGSCVKVSQEWPTGEGPPEYDQSMPILGDFVYPV